MIMNRRALLQGIGGGGLACGLVGALAQNSAGASDDKSGVKIGMCDWNLGGKCKPDLIPKAKEANLDGIQVSVGTDPNSIPLRDPEVRKRYVELGQESGIEFSSVAAGSILNDIALSTEAQSAIYVLDAIEAAKSLGTSCTLLAFFGNGDLLLSYPKNQYGGSMDYRNISGDSPYKIWELDTQRVKRVVDVLKQIAPRAEDAGVILGLENTLSATQNMEIIERAGGSPMLQVYYDVGNSWGNGYDVPNEIRMLGKDRICEVHLKDWKTPLLGSPEGMVDMAACAKAFKDIGYRKWYVLETSGRKDKFIPDTHANVEFARKTFA
ncbi:MAG: sugar phosphate isomerase/epimerase family protein [bacterium]